MNMYRRTFAAVLGLLCLCLFPSAAAAGDPHELSAALSLTGDCGVSAVDPIPDPGCPANPPEGPHPPSGRFDEPRSVAIDAYGNEYVASYAGNGEKGRIDVFDDKGRFITELLDPNGPKSVAVDSKGNLYVLEYVSGGEVEVVRYTPTVYEPEAGKITYGSSGTLIASTNATIQGGLAIDASNDHLFVAFGGGSLPISEYSSAAEGNTLLGTITEKTNWSNFIAVDAERRRLYASYCKTGAKDCGVLVFDADTYELLKELDGSNTPVGDFKSEKGWTSIAVEEDTGHFFVEDLEQTKNVYEFDENYELFATIQRSAFQGGNALQIAVSNGERGGEPAFNRNYLFVPVAASAGRVLAFNPPKVLAPEVSSPTAHNISETEAELRATVDPKGAETEYTFEYVTQGEFEEAGFANALVGGKGTIGKESQPTQVVALLEGLAPGTTYRFRVVASNEKGSDEADGALTTYFGAPVDHETCPNLNLRLGLSSSLPDCRAYELVTPPDTNGRPTVGVGFAGNRFATLQASPSGNAVSFTTEGGVLPGTDGTGGFSGDRYRASRTATGWSTVITGPNGTETDTLLPGSPSPDQGYGFWTAGGEGSAVLNDGETTYIMYPDGHSELVGRGSLGTDPSALGKLITEGAGHIIFQTVNANPSVAQQLEPNAAPTGTQAVYDRTSDEVTHVVSLLPGDVPLGAGQHATYIGASADGEGIAFEVDGTLYLRVGNAVTYEVGAGVTYAGVSEGGGRIFYVKAGNLFAFDTGAEEEIAFTAVGNAIPINVSPDGTRAYFVTTSVIPGGGQNPNGAFAKAGEQNLYLSEEGDITFVATVTQRDVEGEDDASGIPTDGLGLWAQALLAREPARDPSRVTPDGSVLLFQSRANLDGYDPAGSPQIYRYDDVTDRLHCISCIPTGAPASGGASLQSIRATALERAPMTAFGFVPNVRADGLRVFFESREALVVADTDGVQDVYEWEEENVGSCKQSGGCVYLISSGHSARDDYLFGHSSSGDDVFFATEDVLVAGDTDTMSIYDARVGGGFPQQPAEECEGEGCRPVLTPPPAVTPPAQPAPGNDNVVPQRKRKICPKGKRKVKRAGKIRCVKKKKQRKQQQRKASARKGAAR
jgi:hypothetical protein